MDELKMKKIPDYEMYNDQIYKWDEDTQRLVPVTEDEDFVIRLFYKHGYRSIYITKIERTSLDDIRADVMFSDSSVFTFVVNPSNGILQTQDGHEIIFKSIEDVMNEVALQCKRDLASAFQSDIIFSCNREFRRRKGGAKYKRTRNNEKPKYWRHE